MSDVFPGLLAGALVGAIFTAIAFAGAQGGMDKDTAERGFVIISGQLFCRVTDPPAECKP